MPLALEHLPDRLRGAAAGILQGAWAWGYILSALVFQMLYPVLPEQIAWRVLLWTGAVPALFVLWIRARVAESPVWLERTGKREEERGKRAGRMSLARIFQPDLIGTTLQCSVLAAAFMVSYYAVTYWYATFLRERQFNTLPYLIALNGGGIIGSAFWGWISEGRLGRRGAVTCAALLGIVVSPLYVLVSSPAVLMIGAFLVGLGAHGMWGAFPSYLTERFPIEVRGAGAGFCYHAGALVGSFTSSAIGYLRDGGMPLPNAMAMAIAASGLAVAVLIWLGPETRGRAWTG
jgi:MFS family permease